MHCNVVVILVKVDENGNSVAAVPQSLVLTVVPVGLPASLSYHVRPRVQSPHVLLSQPFYLSISASYCFCLYFTNEKPAV